MEDQTINILCATDDNYVPYCGIMLTSVFLNNPTAVAYVMIDKPLSEDNQIKFAKLARTYHTNIHYVMVDSSMFKDFPLYSEQHFTLATYYRLLAALILPASLSKVLYLDCDIIVCRSLEELWNISLEEKSVAVVSDMCSGLDSNYSRLCYPVEKNYFNAGVMLINLEYWRKNAMFDCFKKYTIEHQNRILWNDQDVLNAVLVDSKVHIPLIYNFQMGFLKQSYFETLPKDMQQDIVDVHSPVIVHYNQSKPWCVTYYNLPYNQLWHHYKRNSLWRRMRDMYPKRKVLNYLIKRWLLWPLGFMNQTDTIKI